MKNLWLIACSVLTLTVACKKSADEKPSGGGSTTTSCLVDKETASDGTITQYFYNSSDQVTKVSTIDSSTSDQTYTRTGNVVTVSSDNGTTIMYYLNNKGLADSAVYSLSVLGEVHLNITYDGAGQPSKLVAQGSFFGQDIYQESFFELTNGNITKIRQVEDTTTTITTMTYYTDKTNHMKRTRELVSFMYESPNLLKSETRDGQTTNYTYEFDSNGKPVKVTTDDGLDILTSTISWLCK